MAVPDAGCNTPDDPRFTLLWTLFTKSRCIVRTEDNDEPVVGVKNKLFGLLQRWNGTGYPR